ncbi:MAG: hypothetical protein J5542_10760 [Bacteroidales bacterium]|nr:hypothetical protein [Bacteroidales bacterium]
MKKSILVILSCALSLVLVLGSCKSKTENEAENKDGEAKTECAAKEIKTVEDAIDAMEKYCKEGNKEAVMATYETMMRISFDATLECLKSGKEPEDLFTEEQEKRMEALDGKCECVSSEEMEAVAEKVQFEYEPKIEAVLKEMMGAAGEMNEASE